jgi:uroporphyrin-III C-methyltransferase
MTGLVSLVGAGPGDPELITVRGLRRLQSAQVVVYDRLVHSDLIAEAPAEAERVFAGKSPGFNVLSQEGIERVLVERGRAGKQVVRLKGGDPFVFGRGAEEIEALAAAGIAWEVVPGVTSAVAVPASAGIPVTHRALSSHFTVVTGHESPDKDQSSVDWAWLAASRGTLVILMGLERLEEHCFRLIAEGLDPWTPAAAVASGTLPQQQAVGAPISQLPAAVREAGLRSPAIVIVGEVARFPEIIENTGIPQMATAV